MTQYESAIQLLAEHLNGDDAGLSTSLAEILGAALQELVEAELTATIGTGPGVALDNQAVSCEIV